METINITFGTDKDRNAVEKLLKTMGIEYSEDDECYIVDTENPKMFVDIITQMKKKNPKLSVGVKY